jgi:parallel beta-helix repeat protein
MVYGPGGAILMSSVSPIIRNCLLTGNHATGYHDNSFSGGGGALMIYKESNPLILNNIIKDNIADNLGGGLLFAEHTTGEVRGNVIEGNMALDDWGGGIALYNSPSPLIINNLIIKNSCSGFDGGRGGGIYLGHSSSWLVNNTIAYNSTTGDEYGDGSGGGISISHGAPVIRNCIIWNNRSGEYYMNIDFDLQEWMDIAYCNVEDDLGHIFDLEPHTNMDSLPGFVDPENGNFQLLWNSPCINMGTADTSGLYLPSLDLAGNDRIFEERIDIGAYEYNRPSGKESLSNEADYFVYPNPGSGLIFLTTREVHVHKDLVVQISNSGGELVYMEIFNDAKSVIPIDISAYPEGIYFLTVYSGKQVLFRGKVVKL